MTNDFAQPRFRGRPPMARNVRGPPKGWNNTIRRGVTRLWKYLQRVSRTWRPRNWRLPRFPRMPPRLPPNNPMQHFQLLEDGVMEAIPTAIIPEVSTAFSAIAATVAGGAIGAAGIGAIVDNLARAVSNKSKQIQKKAGKKIDYRPKKELEKKNPSKEKKQQIEKRNKPKKEVAKKKQQEEKPKDKKKPEKTTRVGKKPLKPNPSVMVNYGRRRRPVRRVRRFRKTPYRRKRKQPKRKLKTWRKKFFSSAVPITHYPTDGDLMRYTFIKYTPTPTAPEDATTNYLRYQMDISQEVFDTFVRERLYSSEGNGQSKFLYIKSYNYTLRFISMISTHTFYKIMLLRSNSPDEMTEAVTQGMKYYSPQTTKLNQLPVFRSKCKIIKLKTVRLEPSEQRVVSFKIKYNRFLKETKWDNQYFSSEVKHYRLIVMAYTGLVHDESNNVGYLNMGTDDACCIARTSVTFMALPGTVRDYDMRLTSHIIGNGVSTAITDILVKQEDKLVKADL